MSINICSRQNQRQRFAPSTSTNHQLTIRNLPLSLPDIDTSGPIWTPQTSSLPTARLLVWCERSDNLRTAIPTSPHHSSGLHYNALWHCLGMQSELRRQSHRRRERRPERLVNEESEAVRDIDQRGEQWWSSVWRATWCDSDLRNIRTSQASWCGWGFSSRWLSTSILSAVFWRRPDASGTSCVLSGSEGLLKSSNMSNMFESPYLPRSSAFSNEVRFYGKATVPIRIVTAVAL